jgi:uncharacterized membrane protein
MWARVTEAQTDTSAGQRISPFAAAVVLPIAAITAVIHCIASAFGDGYWFDEVYMLAIGRYHLDWGSADQPPLAPTLAALTDAVAPDSLIMLRIPAVLATAGGVVVAGLIARELGCDRRAQGFTAAAQATGVWTTLFGHWLTPYALEPVQWLLVVWLLVRWVRRRDDRLLLALGVVVGIAALTKFQVLLLCVVLVVTVAVVARANCCADGRCGLAPVSPPCSLRRRWCGNSCTAGRNCGWRRWSQAKPKPSTAGVQALRCS